ncbi:MAG: hypothetical protein ABJA60_05730, partial [Nitrosospira sp.]
CKNLLPMVVITQYIYATRDAFISDVMRFIAQTNVCATHSTDVVLAQLRQEPIRYGMRMSRGGSPSFISST